MGSVLRTLILLVMIVPGTFAHNASAQESTEYTPVTLHKEKSTEPLAELRVLDVSEGWGESVPADVAELEEGNIGFLIQAEVENLDDETYALDPGSITLIDSVGRWRFATAIFLDDGSEIKGQNEPTDIARGDSLALQYAFQVPEGTAPRLLKWTPGPTLDRPMVLLQLQEGDDAGLGIGLNDPAIMYDTDGNEVGTFEVTNVSANIHEEDGVSTHLVQVRITNTTEFPLTVARIDVKVIDDRAKIQWHAPAGFEQDGVEPLEHNAFIGANETLDTGLYVQNISGGTPMIVVWKIDHLYRWDAITHVHVYLDVHDSAP